MKTRKFTYFVVTLLLVTGMSTGLFHKASADTDSIDLSVTWDGNCNDAPSGNQQTRYYLSGDTVNINVTNNSSQTLDISVNNNSNGDSSGNGSSVTAGNSYPYSGTLSDSIDILAQADNCGVGESATVFYVYGASTATPLNCSSTSQVWNVTAAYDNTAPVDYLYRGSIYVAEFETEKGGGGSGDFNETFQFSGQSTAQTYYLYDGTSNADTLLGQTTCPAVSAPPSAPTSSSPAAPTTSSKPTSTPTSTTTSSSSSSKPTASATTVPVSPVTLDSKNTGLWAGLSSGSKAFIISFLALIGLLTIATLAGFWKVLTKAGRHGWIAIIPGYNTWVIYELGGKPGWWIWLQFIPIVNIVALAMLVVAEIEIAKRFGKNWAFGVFGLFIFTFIGWPLLGFSKAKYLVGAKSKDTTDPSYGKVLGS